MGKIRLRYYTIRRSSRKVRGYWQPTKEMREAGFGLVSCGQDGPAAWQIAEEWNQRWDEHRHGGEVRRWPAGSVGAAFDDFRATGVWAAKKPRTQEDWWRGWAYIGHAFADIAPETVVLAQLDAWYRSVVAGKGVREGWRALKIWRALWGVMAALGYCHKPDPSKAIRRQTPAARQEVWNEAEVVRLVLRAWRLGYRGLACIIAISFDGALSPVDVRKLTFAQMTDGGHKITFHIERAKTGRAALGTLGKRASVLVRAYIATLDRGGGPRKVRCPSKELPPPLHLPTAVIFRHRKGRPYTKDGLSHDFAMVRQAVFGTGEARTLADMRRSAAVEALAGGAHAAQIGAKLANSLSASQELHRTYLPVDKGAVEAVDAARIKGRRKK